VSPLSGLNPLYIKLIVFSVIGIKLPSVCAVFTSPDEVVDSITLILTKEAVSSTLEINNSMLLLVCGTPPCTGSN